MSIIQPICQPICRPIVSKLTDYVSSAIFPKPGDYLLTAVSGDYLTDESGNRLTA